MMALARAQKDLQLTLLARCPLHPGDDHLPPMRLLPKPWVKSGMELRVFGSLDPGRPASLLRLVKLVVITFELAESVPSSFLSLESRSYMEVVRLEKLEVSLLFNIELSLEVGVSWAVELGAKGELHHRRASSGVEASEEEMVELIDIGGVALRDSTAPLKLHLYAR